MEQPILAVDDEADLVTTYERLLRRQGCRVLSPRTCQAGLSVVWTEPLDLVIADLRLPDGDGLGVVRAPRALHTSPGPRRQRSPDPDGPTGHAGRGSRGVSGQAYRTDAFICLVDELLSRSHTA